MRRLIAYQNIMVAEPVERTLCRYSKGGIRCFRLRKIRMHSSAI